MDTEFKRVDPKCPECKFQPLQFNNTIMPLENGAIISIIWCIHCGHTLNTQCLGVDYGPRIARPS